ncbi:MAG TPA: DUF1343 domain-containing protein [Puia sp.]|nr:DUF1343 domain-containing protein [Puia sp.]
MKIAIISGVFLLLSAVLSGQPSPTSINQPVLASPMQMPPAPILPGAAQMDLYLPLLQGKTIAVFANQTSTIGNTHLVDTLLKKGIHIIKIFAPEHGFRGDADAGEHVNSQADPKTGIPIISLYGSKDQPSAADLRDVDIMLFDIQDVGVRFYTYISSLQKYLESAIVNHRPVIVLDRPDPNGSYVDGPILDPTFKSFVGMQPIPVVYGMTIGEYGRMLVGERWLDTTAHAAPNNAANATAPLTQSNEQRTQHTPQGSFRLTVIPCRNYTHKSKYVLPVQPSPNLPNMQSVYLYPSICFFEGTAISLGRGTDKPFQQYGNPSFPKDLYHFTPLSLSGAKNPPLLNQICYGYDLSTIEVEKETGNRLSLKWLLNAYRLFPDKEHFFPGEGKFFNKLAGSDLLQQQIKEGRTEAEIRQSWTPALTRFKAIRKKYLLYAD